jgi:hypothetical protein
MVISKRVRWAGHEYKILVGNTAGEKTLGTPKHRWKDNIKLDRREIGTSVCDWIHLAQEWCPYSCER